MVVVIATDVIVIVTITAGHKELILTSCSCHLKNMLCYLNDIAVLQASLGQM